MKLCELFALLVSLERGVGRMYHSTWERGKVMKCIYFSSCLLDGLSEVFWENDTSWCGVQGFLSIYICRSVTT